MSQKDKNTVGGSDTARRFHAGDIIMRQGEKGDTAYIIEDGRVDISIQMPSGKEQSVTTRGKGAMIGEMALVDKAPRTATVRALSECTLLEITAEDFSRRLENADPILRMATQVILTRYRDTLTRADITSESTKWPPAELVEREHSGNDSIVENIKIANEFKAAFDRSEISLHYQPIIDLKTHEIAGFEALMRWNHPERGFISPGVFIPIAEDTGSIVAASQWALKEACLALRRIERRTGYDRDLFMSVNFSSRDFASEDFVDSVYETISKSDVSPNKLHIEITERLLIDQPENAKDTLKMCRDAGIHISIDDFGTGYSSLSYLHYFPINTLKIDQSFVRDMHKDDTCMALVKSIIDLGKNMKMDIIAEGVENPEEATILHKLGCDLAQGYFFAKPMPEIEVTEFVSNSGKFDF